MADAPPVVEEDPDSPEPVPKISCPIVVVSKPIRCGHNLAGDLVEIGE